MSAVKSAIHDVAIGRRFRLGGAEFTRRGEVDSKPGYFWCEFQSGRDGEGYYHMLYGYEVVEVISAPLPPFLRGYVYRVEGYGTLTSRWYCHGGSAYGDGLQFTSDAGVRKSLDEFRSFISRNDYTVKVA